MVITEVRIKLVENNSERLLAFCSVTIDQAFVVRDLKVIEGQRGLFVAMPSRKLTDRCTRCSCKNHLRARFCNQCGSKLDEARGLRDHDGRAKLHADIAHPIHAGGRELIQNAVSKAYAEEREKAKMPGYVCRYDEYDAGDYEDVPSGYGHLVKAHGPHDTTKSGTHMSPTRMPAKVPA
jgi:stage V sporulation protein G